MYLASGVDSGASLHLKNYVYIASTLYPVFYGLAVFLSRAALRREAVWGKILLLACIPVLSGFPLLLLWGLYLDLSL